MYYKDYSLTNDKTIELFYSSPEFGLMSSLALNSILNFIFLIIALWVA